MSNDAKKIIVKATRDGFRRAGHSFNREGTVLEVASLSKDQLEAIKAEPMLVVADYAEPKAAK